MLVSSLLTSFWHFPVMMMTLSMDAEDMSETELELQLRTLEV